MEEKPIQLLGLLFEHTMFFKDDKINGGFQVKWVFISKKSGSLFPKNSFAFYHSKGVNITANLSLPCPPFSRALSKTLTKGNVNTYFWATSSFAIFFSITRSTYWSLPFVLFMISRYRIYCCVLRPHIKSIWLYLYSNLSIFYLSRMYSNQFGGLSTYNFSSLSKISCVFAFGFIIHIKR